MTCITTEWTVLFILCLWVNFVDYFLHSFLYLHSRTCLRWNPPSHKAWQKQKVHYRNVGWVCMCAPVSVCLFVCTCVCVWVSISQQNGSPDRFRISVTSPELHCQIKQTSGTEEIFSRAPCIMDGLKRLTRSCSPAVDAVCRCSLETSGHCLVAVRVIALLLEGPAKRVGREWQNEIFMSFFLSTHTYTEQKAHNPISIPQVLPAFGFKTDPETSGKYYTFFMMSHEAVMKNKYSLSKAPVKCGWKNHRARQ